ncbi:hypothetical protein CLOM_g2098 [Closterium sp. NIES-68]|nr:hypothetical protein CLOM_g2098 [Closterium sp. NIES-68]GJP71789.1 hypothetical protein CLOP_g2581 [Closterium sp. NIES-67]
MAESSGMVRADLLDFDTFAKAEGIGGRTEGVVLQKALPPQARPQPDQRPPPRPQSNGAQRDAERRQHHQPLLVETPPCRSPSDSLGANSIEATPIEANSLEVNSLPAEGRGAGAEKKAACLEIESGDEGTDGRGEEKGDGKPAWDMDMSKVLCTNQLAAGAFGRVYHGLYGQDDVAVKLISVSPSMPAKELEGIEASILQEISVWHTLSHPNIVQFIGASLDAANIVAPAEAKPPPGTPLWAIVTEYMSGGTLRNYLARRRRLGEKDVVRIALDVARGLEYLHSHHIVHRDLKSDNILVSYKGNVKIADFGVARTEAKNAGDMTCETGTVRWMAPEVIDHKPYTRKVDVYSYGIVLWELVTCELPFKGLTFIQLAYNVVHKNQRPDIPPSCNPELARLMAECWDRDPAARPEFADIVPRLERIQAEVGPGGEGGTRAEKKVSCCTVS